MKSTKYLFGTLSAFAFAASGCIISANDPGPGPGPDPDPETGTLEFDYVLLLPDINGDIIAATSCDQAGVDSVRLMVGDDFDGDGILDDNEIQDEDTDVCNQFDANGDGFIDQAEFGFYEGVFFEDSYDLFAVEFIAGNGAQLWETFDQDTAAERFSFQGGISIIADAANVIPFSGDGAQTASEELQAFFFF